MTITVAQIRAAITIANAGGTPEMGYNQSKWCGSARCVLGHARIIAGVAEIDDGPQSGEIEDSPAGRVLARLMGCVRPDILRAMRAVGDDGIIGLAHADLRGINLRGADLSHADLSHADLSEADLSHADLTGADLTNADITGADLRGIIGYAA